MEGKKQKRERGEENPFLVPRTPLAERSQDREKHRFLKIGNKYRDGLRGSMAEELMRQAGLSTMKAL